VGYGGPWWCGGFEPSRASGVASLSASPPLGVPLRAVPPSARVTGHYLASCVRPSGMDPRLPGALCTPGSVRGDVTQDNINSTVCRPGWAAKVRPPQSETGTVKTEAMRAYRIPAGQRGVTQLDHLMPIELGGSSDVTKLWPQVSDEPDHGNRNTKDDVEAALRTAVCTGRVPLAAAQQAITTTAGHRCGQPHP
jgi:hypothetical protein